MEDKGQKGKETDDSAPPPPRKGRLKFRPKAPRKKVLEIVPKMESQEESKIQTIDKDLMMNLKTSQSTDPLERRAKAEKKEARTQVAFGQVNHSIARSFPAPKSSSSEKDVHPFSKSMLSDITTSAAKLPKESDEPQDYTHPNYNYPPITLPLRRPYSGDPEILDEEEFGEFPSRRAQDGELTAAAELGLMDTEDMMNNPQLLFFQFPASLPSPTQVESVAEADTDTSEDVETEGTKSKENDEKKRLESIHGCNLKDLPGGLMGKVLVYKSGKVKLRLGNAIFDVSAGLNCAFAQEAVVINTNKKRCCSLGEVSKRAVVTPDIDYLLGSMEKME